MDGKQVRILHSRQQEVSRPVFIISNKSLPNCLETHQVALGNGEFASVTSDWEGYVHECGEEKRMITRFDSLKSIPYPCSNCVRIGAFY